MISVFPAFFKAQNSVLYTLQTLSLAATRHHLHSHSLQNYPLYEELYEMYWTGHHQQTSVAQKLFGSLQDLWRTTAFVEDSRLVIGDDEPVEEEENHLHLEKETEKNNESNYYMSILAKYQNSGNFVISIISFHKKFIPRYSELLSINYLRLTS